MKKYFLIIYLLFNVTIYSQNGYVEYGYIESLGLGNAQGLDYNAILLFNKSNSYYVTAKESLEKMDKIAATKIVEKDGEVKAVFNGMGVSENGDQVYFSNNNKTMLSTLNFRKSIHKINDGVVTINWKIENETKKIGTFSCTKATASFRGRNYTAWFTTDVPVSYGPWKLNGLPGLILEAYDNDKFVYWYFKNLEYPSTKTEVIKAISEINVLEYIEYAEFKKAQEEEIKKIEDKNAILMKDIPGMTITSPKFNELFLECE